MGASLVKRLPDEDRWDLTAIEQIKGVPWNLSGVEGAPEVVFRDIDPDAADGPLPVLRPEVPMPRRLKIMRADLDEHRVTRGFPGCDAQISSRRSGTCLVTTSHSEECRGRLLEAIRQTPEGSRCIDEAVEHMFEHIGRQGPQHQAPQPPESATTAPPVAAEGAQDEVAQNEAAQTEAVQNYETEAERVWRERIGRPAPWDAAASAAATAPSRKRSSEVPAGDARDMDTEDQGRESQG